MAGEALRSAIEAARQSEPFRYYLHVRDLVLEMLEQAQSTADRPSDYWAEELAGFTYLLDASPLIIQRLREHCYHISGLRSYEYRTHHAHQTGPFEAKLRALKEQDQDALFVPESPLLGGFGHTVDGVMVNVDTLKFHESLIAMNKAGLLDAFRRTTGRRKVVIEIGAGWGGFAYQFKTLFPDTCYVIVDLPPTLLFSAVYLKALFPAARMLVYGEKPFDSLLEGYESYDFIFLPSYSFTEAPLKGADLAVNICSFQEMTTEQVTAYARKLAELNCPYLYSHNRNRSPHNSQLSTVSSIVGTFYETKEWKVLDIPYTNLVVPKATGGSGFHPVKLARTVAMGLLGIRRPAAIRPVHEYRHLVGTLKQPGIVNGEGRVATG
jgi:putative sugar O-methyltransferase